MYIEWYWVTLILWGLEIPYFFFKDFGTTFVVFRLWDNIFCIQTLGQQFLYSYFGNILCIQTLGQHFLYSDFGTTFFVFILWDSIFIFRLVDNIFYIRTSGKYFLYSAFTTFILWDNIFCIQTLGQHFLCSDFGTTVYVLNNVIRSVNDLSIAIFTIDLIGWHKLKYEHQNIHATVLFKYNLLYWEVVIYTRHVQCGK